MAFRSVHDVPPFMCSSSVIMLFFLRSPFILCGSCLPRCSRRELYWSKFDVEVFTAVYASMDGSVKAETVLLSVMFSSLKSRSKEHWPSDSLPYFIHSYPSNRLQQRTKCLSTHFKPPTVGGLGQPSMALGLLCLVDPPSPPQTYVSLFFFFIGARSEWNWQCKWGRWNQFSQSQYRPFHAKVCMRKSGTEVVSRKSWDFVFWSCVENVISCVTKALEVHLTLENRKGQS